MLRGGPAFRENKPCCISKDRFPNRGQALGAATNFAAFYSNTTGDLHALENREGKPRACKWIVHVVRYSRYSKGVRRNKKERKREGKEKEKKMNYILDSDF